MPRVRTGKPNGRPRRVGVTFAFREFCRTVVADPQVQSRIQEAARANPEFALRVAEHGFGRPPQALDVTISDKAVIRHIVTLASGELVSPAAAGLPGGGDPVDREGRRDD